MLTGIAQGLVGNILHPKIRLNGVSVLNPGVTAFKNMVNARGL